MVVKMTQHQFDLLDTFGRRFQLGDLIVYGGGGTIYIAIPAEIILPEENAVGWRKIMGSLKCKSISVSYPYIKGESKYSREPVFKKRSKEFSFGFGEAEFLYKPPYPPDFDYNKEISTDSNFRYTFYDQATIPDVLKVDREIVTGGNGKAEGYIAASLELQDEVRRKLGLSVE